MPPLSSGPLSSGPLSPGPLLWLRALEDGDPASLSPEERDWADRLPERQRHRYRQSRAGLRHQLAVVLGCAPQRVPLHSPPGLPPRLPAGLGWISLSHSGEALLMGYSREPIGVDLEARERRLDAGALMRRFYPAAERAQLEALAGEELRRAVLTSWVLKEAAVKWRERSLAAELTQWCVDHARLALHHLGDGARPDCCTATLGPWRWAAVGLGCGPALQVDNLG